MKNLRADEVLQRIREALPEARVESIANGASCGQDSLLVHRDDLLAVVRVVKEHGDLRLDYASNVTGVDWPGKDGGGYLEVVYHLYSVARRHGPVVLRVRTGDRDRDVAVPSLTPVYRSAEFQECEIYDLFGVRFEGHPHLRRLLMWDGFDGHPMRKDFQVRDAESGMRNGEAARVSFSSESRVASSELEETEVRTLDVSLGPQHPSTHGVFRMNVKLDGETVVKLEPVFGYLHRNHEKLAEKMSWLASMPFTDRLDYLCPLTNNWGYALAVEKLMGIEVPERAEYIRIILAELTRLQNHTAFLGFLLGDMGAWGSALMYAFREREKILDLFEALTGARMMGNYMRFGGCRVDLPPGWLEAARKVVDNYPAFLDEMEMFLTGNEILMARLQGIGVIGAEAAIDAGLSGPVLRASNVDYDIRKVDGYGLYNRFKFRVPRGEKGDCFDRFMIRILEMRESLAILKQALDGIPGGPVQNPKVKTRGLRPPAGEAYGRIESPKGELGFYLVSGGADKPYRYRVRPPSLINLTLLEQMSVGQKTADLMVSLGTIDIVMGEVDR